jgi:hypothetical protein
MKYIGFVDMLGGSFAPFFFHVNRFCACLLGNGSGKEEGVDSVCSLLGTLQMGKRLNEY